MLVQFLPFRWLDLTTLLMCRILDASFKFCCSICQIPCISGLFWCIEGNFADFLYGRSWCCMYNYNSRGKLVLLKSQQSDIECNFCDSLYGKDSELHPLLTISVPGSRLYMFLSFQIVAVVIGYVFFRMPSVNSL